MKSEKYTDKRSIWQVQRKSVLIVENQQSFVGELERVRYVEVVFQYVTRVPEVATYRSVYDTDTNSDTRSLFFI